MHASEGSEFVIDKILKQNEGVTYSLLQTEEGEEPEKPEDLPTHILIDEVVREPKIHYYQVPRLGSFMAIKLEYESCLFEEAFDFAVSNYNEV